MKWYLANFAATMDLPGSRGYHDKVIDHYENPRNVGSLDKNDVNVGTGLVGAPACGDVMKLQVGSFLLEPVEVIVTLQIYATRYG